MSHGPEYGWIDADTFIKLVERPDPNERGYLDRGDYVGLLDPYPKPSKPNRHETCEEMLQPSLIPDDKWNTFTDLQKSALSVLATLGSKASPLGSKKWTEEVYGDESSMNTLGALRRSLEKKLRELNLKIFMVTTPGTHACSYYLDSIDI